jgi:hypothetical protein
MTESHVLPSDREAEFFAGLPASGVGHVLLQRAEEGLHGGVVAGRAVAARGADEIVVVEQSADLLGTELAAAVGVQNRPRRALERDGVADRGRGQLSSDKTRLVLLGLTHADMGI